MGSPGVAVRLTRASGQYHVGETVSGTVRLSCPSSSSSGLASGAPQLTVLRVVVRLTGFLRLKSIDGCDLQERELLCRQVMLLGLGTRAAPPGDSAVTELPFQLPLTLRHASYLADSHVTCSATESTSSSATEAICDSALYESYHGLCVQVKYMLSTEVEWTARPPSTNALARMLSGHPAIRSTKEVVQILVVRAARTNDAAPVPDPGLPLRDYAVNFLISPDTGRSRASAVTPAGAGSTASLPHRPHICVRGRLDSVNCRLDRPLTGHLVLETVPLSGRPAAAASDGAGGGGSDAHWCCPRVRSVELQLVRTESVMPRSTDCFSHSSEVLSLQVALLLPDTGLAEEPEYNVRVPFRMVFPRHFTCATTRADHFWLEFSLNIVLLLEDELSLTENFPLFLYRPHV